MPVLADIIGYATDFWADYLVFVAAAAIISLMVWGLRRVLKAGR